MTVGRPAIAEGFQAAALRRRIWLGLWESSCATTLSFAGQPAKAEGAAALAWDRAYTWAIEANSAFVRAGVLLQNGELDRAAAELADADRLMAAASPILGPGVLIDV